MRDSGRRALRSTPRTPADAWRDYRSVLEVLPRAIESIGRVLALCVPLARRGGLQLLHCPPGEQLCQQLCIVVGRAKARGGPLCSPGALAGNTSLLSRIPVLVAFDLFAHRAPPPIDRR